MIMNRLLLSAIFTRAKINGKCRFRELLSWVKQVVYNCGFNVTKVLLQVLCRMTAICLNSEQGTVKYIYANIIYRDVR